ncbi:nuclear factor 7, ovary [Bombina bombina]|uniref:nuclear factor 7, ovary n=1 Tax=Bombina bombina TaxID=8345 RepID=UPI00235AAB64|nr:nuclear factor 7, ovary [Bombina bombina]
MSLSILRDELQCSICLEVYTEPVFLTCGHNFCKDCIVGVFDNRVTSLIFNCPECRMTFESRPKLQKNLKLSNIVEHYFSTAKEYALMENTPCPVSRTCAIHNKLLEYHCTEDEAFACASCCIIGKHKGHEVELLANSSRNKKEELKTIVQKLLSGCKNIDKTVHDLKTKIKVQQEKATEIESRALNLFDDIRKLLDKLQSQVLYEIQKQQDDILLKVAKRIQQMEKDKGELQQKIHLITNVLKEEDPISLITDHKKIIPIVPHSAPRKQDVVDKLDYELISVTLQNNLQHLVGALPKLQQKNGFYVECASDTLLDVTTASHRIGLSKDLKTAFHINANNLQPISQNKFTFCQVLSTNSFKSGQHYLEVLVSNEGVWTIGLAYASIKRRGTDSLVGCNDRSWGLCWMDGNLSALHNSESRAIPIDTPIEAIGLYLDYEAGRLSFYQVSNQIKLLHTFSTKFTEALYLVIYICGNTCARIKI